MSMIIKTWTTDDEKRFELAQLQFPENSLCFLENIAQLLQKPVNEVKYYYICKSLLDDDLPTYPEDKEKKRKGNHWSEDEHISFLYGLEKYGQGDWKSISRDFVKSKVQDASGKPCAENFERQKTKGKRNSIHDITLEDVRISNLELIGQQQQQFGVHTPLGLPLMDNIGLYLNDNEEYRASFQEIRRSNLEPMGQQQQFGVQTHLDLPLVDNNDHGEYQTLYHLKVEDYIFLH